MTTESQFHRLSIAALTFGAAVGVTAAASLHVYSSVLVAQAEITMVHLGNQTGNDYLNRLNSLAGYLHPIFSYLFIGFVIWGIMALFCSSESDSTRNGFWVFAVLGALAYVWAMGNWMWALQV